MINAEKNLKVILKFLIFFFWAHTLSAQTVSTIYGSGRHPLVEIFTQGQTQTQTLHIFGPGGQILAQVANGETGYLLADHGRSTRVVLKEDNSLLGSFDYTPYGETISTGDVDSVQYRYVGQPMNSGFNNYHFYQREYDPNTLRFTSMDPSRYNESPYIYSNSNPTNFTDPTGAQPQYLTLWLNQKVSSTDTYYTSMMEFTSRYRSTASGDPRGIVFGDLALADTTPVRGHIFSEDVRLGSIVVNAHGSQDVVAIAGRGTYMGPESFLGHLLHRVNEIDSLGVEQVSTITLFACLGGASCGNRPSFADRFLIENSALAREGYPHFSNLDRVVSSPYLMGLVSKESNRNFMNIEFSTPLKWSQRSKSYFTDSLMATLDTAQFLKGNGLYATRGINNIVYRNYYAERNKKRLLEVERYDDDEPKDDSGELSFSKFFLKESTVPEIP